MKVLQFITRLDLGGAQETCLQQCKLLLRRGDEVHLLTGAGGELMTDARALSGLLLHVWPDWLHRVAPVRDLRCLLRLARMIRRERFDLLHTHCSKAGFVGRLAAAVAGGSTRVIHHVHGWSFNPIQPWAVRRALIALERLAARPGFVLLTCSESTAAEGRRARIGRDEDRKVLHYGIDRTPNLRRRGREAIRRRLGLGREDVLFLQVGNLKPQKDPVTFALASVEAGRALGRARFWIVGDGPLRAAAERIARDGGLGRRFKLLGWRRDVPDLLAAADVLVLTSRFEGLPIAVLRGMAAGLPIVATRVDGTPEAVDGAGFIVPPGDVGAVAAAFVALGRSPRLRRVMGQRGRRRSARFTERRAELATLALYHQCPDSRGGGRPVGLRGTPD